MLAIAAVLALVGGAALLEIDLVLGALVMVVLGVPLAAAAHDEDDGALNNIVGWCIVAALIYLALW